MQEIKMGDFTARQESEYWNIYYKDKLIGSGDDEQGIRFDNLIESNVTQTTWFHATDLFHLYKLSQAIQ